MKKSEIIAELAKVNSREDLNEVAELIDLDPKNYTTKEDMATAIVTLQLNTPAEISKVVPEGSGSISLQLLKEELQEKAKGAMEGNAGLNMETLKKKMPLAELTEKKIEPTDDVPKIQHAWFGEESKEGDTNSPAIEMTEKDKEEILSKQESNKEKADKIKELINKYENGENEWKVICSARNDVMSYSFKTLAMKVGRSRGILVCTIESMANKSSMSTVYLPEKILVLENKKWFIRSV